MCVWRIKGNLPASGPGQVPGGGLDGGRVAGVQQTQSGQGRASHSGGVWTARVALEGSWGTAVAQQEEGEREREMG